MNARKNSDPSLWSVSEISNSIQAGELSSVDLVDAFLHRISNHDATLHAYVEVYTEQARLAARAADDAMRAGQSLGPLHGIPIAIKDLVEIAGRVVTDGCAVWKARRSTTTATVIRRLVQQGVIVLGKTHMVEFAFGAWGTNTQMGTPRNPWDNAAYRAPGGSSSGNGVAIAAGLAPWAIGTDTGGSVRIPASWCGLTSLKPSPGRISSYGVLPLSQTLDTPGPMGRCARDIELLYKAIQGPDPRDAHTLGLPPFEHTPERTGGERGIVGMRLAKFPDSERHLVTKDVLDAYDRALDKLADLGADIVTANLPLAFAEVAELTGKIMAAESYALFATLVDDQAATLDENVRSRVLAGKHISACDYLCALARRRELTNALERCIVGIDAIVAPTTATTAPLLTDVDENGAPSFFTRFANFFSLCALALPTGFDHFGLPTSLQLIGHRYDETTLLRIARVYQEHTEWHLRRPVCD